ncbi:MAG: hypothetical protein KDK97_23585 [Verrucomicrobiales bacterium]|nr:hypothetical protein [Verrucomicrobiales bacterium]MCP5560854.1 hypothetical protein [Verrucomicrobiaceae bacterium]
MKPILTFFATIALTAAVSAEELGQLLFQDDFERSESQEQKDEPGQGWGTNSASRAKGNKQVDLRDGAMYIYLSSEADHAVSVTHPAEFTDGAVSMRFMLEDEKDSLGLDFADLGCKEVHAGHLFAARVSPKNVTLQDLKTGGMRLDISEARKAKQKLTEEQQKAMEGKTKTIPSKVAVGKWHDLVVRISGDELSASIDGKDMGSLHAPGIAHPTKKMLRLSVPRNAVVDDVKIWKK